MNIIKKSKQIRKKLAEEYNNNCLKINDLNEKIKMISANDIETKVKRAMGFSLIPLVISILTIVPIMDSGFIPLNLVQPFFVGVPALIGITAEELYTRKSKYRENLREFSNSKTQKEKIEESTRYEIEKEKLKSLNKILKKSYDDLLANENMISSLSKNYNITEKNSDNKTAEEITENIKNMNDLLAEKQQDAYIATTKCVLKEKFGKVRDKFKRFSDILVYSIMSGLLCMLYDMPLLSKDIQFETSFIGVLAPAIIGSVVGGSYCIKRKKDYTSIFKKFNKELKENAISESGDYEEDKQFDKDLENIIKDTCAIKLQLETEKQKLKNVHSISNSESVMNDFMKKLNDNELTRDKEPTVGKELAIDEKFIDVQLEKYEKLLKSPIMQGIEESTIEGPKLVQNLIPKDKNTKS